MPVRNVDVDIEQLKGYASMFPPNSFFEVPFVSESDLVTLCYRQIIDGYWDTSGEATVFKIRFPSEEA